MILGNNSFQYSGSFPNFSFFDLISLLWNFWKIDSLGRSHNKSQLIKDFKLAKTIDLDYPERSPNAKELDSMTGTEWANKNIPNEKIRRSFIIGLICVLGKDPKEVSMLWILFYIHSAGNINFRTIMIQKLQKKRRI